eukprot:XP_019074572.1 PREDICTED: eugenol synthase 1 isoform X1 [Vitis vinifera]
MESVLSSILIFGGTGYIGRCMVKASVKMGHPTYVYSRPTTPQTHSSKIELLKEFQSMGVDIVQGELDEHEKLVLVIQQVDVVISALAYPQVLDQLNIIDAIKVAGTTKVRQYELLGIRTCLGDKVGEFKNRCQRQYKLFEPKPTSPAT